MATDPSDSLSHLAASIDQLKRGFGSDNHSGAHPRMLEAVINANRSHAPSYGTDPWTLAMNDVFKKLFYSTAVGHFVFNGTAANVLALSPYVQSYHAVITSHASHMINDECGAPEKHLGCHMVAIDTTGHSDGGKLTVPLIEPYMVRAGDQHASQIRAISITQPTEFGVVYTIQEIQALSAFAKKHGLILHMDGTRVVNAAASLGCSLKTITVDCGVDVLSLGGTKNGLLFGEAVVFFNPNENVAQNFKYLRKQMMQLPSKTRFIAAQFLEYIGTDLWLENALRANRLAKKLEKSLKQDALSPFFKFTQPVQANACFVQIPRHWIAKMREASFFYVWNEHTFECRLMTSWDTEDSEIENFTNAAIALAQAERNI
jgi:threonine aldolase